MPIQDARLLNALISIWLRPRSTIGPVLAWTKQVHIFSLAALGAIEFILVQFIGADASASLFDLRIVAAIVVGGTVVGIISLLVGSFILRSTGRLLGGRASPWEMRGLIAWGTVPNAFGLALCVITLAAGKFLGGTVSNGWPLGVITALSLILVGLSIWSWVITFGMLARVQGFGLWRAAANFALGGVLTAILMLLPLSFRTFVFEPFNIPGASMSPTLLVGDYFFVSKFSYGFSRHSLPYSLHLFDGRIFFHEPERGDLVVFKFPADNRIDYVKRVVGLPGDHIQIIHRVLNINGKPVDRIAVGDFVAESDARTGRSERFSQYVERLPNGREYRIVESMSAEWPADNTAEYVVPAGHYFMLGDNRDHSQDSRFLDSVGYVSKDNLVGRAEIIVFSRDTKLGMMRFERLGLLLH